METIGIIYEITGNPYFNNDLFKPDHISEYTYPTEIDDICKAFLENGYQFEIIDGAFDLLLREQELKKICRIFFNKSIGFRGLERKMPVPILGQLYDLPIIGSKAYSMTLARHKFHTNKLLKGLGFLTPNAQIVYSLNNKLSIAKFPVIVKPNAESDSLGIKENSICYSLEDVLGRVEEIASLFGLPIIIEEYIPGDEIKVAVIGNGVNSIAAGEVKVLKRGIPIQGSLQTREDILQGNITYADVENIKLRRRVQLMAQNIHDALELNDYSRVDFRMGDRNKIYCLEVSTHPYIAITDSSFTSAALQRYSNYTAVIGAIIEVGRQRLGV